MTALTAIYVPGSKPERFDKALSSIADVVILDLEDAVPVERKAYARDAVAEFLRSAAPGRISVRINPLDTPWGRDDLGVASYAALRSLRLPKVESPEDVREVIAVHPVGVDCLIETARGLENLDAIASAVGVSAIALGEADLRADLGVTGETVLGWARARLVVAARSAGLTAPMQSVFTDLHDNDGLVRTTVDGRAEGFIGRGAIHPSQLELIVSAVRPTPSEVEWAAELLSALSADADAVAVIGGRMVDRAMIAGARRTLEIEAAVAERLSNG